MKVAVKDMEVGQKYTIAAFLGDVWLAEDGKHYFEHPKTKVISEIVLAPNVLLFRK